MTQYIRTSVEGHVGHVVLNRPDVHNAFNDVMIAEIIEAFQNLGRSEDARVIVLSAEGKSFCAGADLNWMSKMVEYTFEENVIDALGLAKMLKAIHDCPKPVIARVHGAAFGGGVGLISACDFAVCTSNATFALTEVKLGLIPAVISPFVLQKMPTSAAQRYFITAEKFDAQEARRVGLIADVVGDIAEMDAWIKKAGDAIAANGPEAVMASKELMNRVLDFGWERAMDLTAQMIAARRISSEGQEGMKAFFEKRPASWVKQHAEA